ncbi:MAG: addiction module antidote protein, HigA family [Alphaproteobacteria bacterium]|nr:addiction module antidote protein, HigA family [Alphaproteobacteria bacterium]
MKNRRMNPAHPGKILKQEFMEPLRISNYRLAQASGLSQTIVGRIVNGKAGITADVALRLEAVLGMDAQTWMNMQNTFDLLIARQASGKDIAKKSVRLYEHDSAMA